MSEKTRPGIPDLAPNRTDRLLSLANAVCGLRELGSVLTEVIGTVLPHQRIDRIVNVLEILEARVTDVELDAFQSRLQASEEARDLLEEGIVQSARALSDSRREQIAEMLKSTITQDDLSFMQKKRLWAILAALTDHELVILQWHGVINGQEHEEFWERHQSALTGPIVHMGSTSDEIDQGAVHSSYETHLRDLGLLRTRFKRPRPNSPPEWDLETGMLKSQGHELTRLGGVLLRHLGLSSTI